MSIEKTNVVDWLGLEKDTGAIMVTVVDDTDWSDEWEHLRLLEAKLNVYIAFIESGEVFDQVANIVGHAVSKTTPIKVLIIGKYELTPAASEFVTYAQTTLHRAGLSLVHEVLAAP